MDFALKSKKMGWTWTCVVSIGTANRGSYNERFEWTTEKRWLLTGCDEKPKINIKSKKENLCI